MKPEATEPRDTARTLPRVLLGGDLYKVGYVVADRDEAARALEGAYGFEPLVRAEVRFEAVLPDGNRVETHLACALTTGREHLIEVMQPVSGAVDLWTDALKGPGPLLRFHNIGLLTDDLEKVKATAAQHQLPLELSAHHEGAWSFAYHRVPLLGHLVEHIHYVGAAGDELDRIRGLSRGF
ncbi:VOC family protein [Saccharopolyspora sp. MS10]|uniref:VOC family protein n=1 Tax=Saccharopolyspora sp. MS10 TaxID=3385973 RepID=UPI00399F7006